MINGMRCLILLFCASLSALPTVSIEGPTVIPITLEHAVTAKQRAWGLMQRKSLPENHGMTFNYPYPQPLSCWMFNCYIDLSLAYLDQDKVIHDIFLLKAYPKKMDPKRPVTSLGDMKKYPSNDPITQFFRSKSVSSTILAQYALEMPAGWFDRHGIKSGDVVLWNVSSPDGAVLLTIDIDNLGAEKPFLLAFPEEAPHALTGTKPFEVSFLSSSDKVMEKARLEKPGQVVITKTPAKYALVTPI